MHPKHVAALGFAIIRVVCRRTASILLCIIVTVLWDLIQANSVNKVPRIQNRKSVYYGM